MKVRVAVHGRFHAFELARGLYRRGLLECLQTTYPAFAARRVVGAGVPLCTVPSLEIRRRLGARLGFAKSLDVSIARGFGRALARSLADSEADILVGWSSATLEAIGTAHDKGMRVVIERGSTHISHQTEVLQGVHRELGLDTNITPSEIIARELAEYDAADAIVVPSEMAARTFIAHGIAREKVFVNYLGVDVAQFTPPPVDRHNPTPVIVFVGMLSARKGTATLLKAFAALDQPAELVLVGAVDPAFRKIMESLPSQRVTVRGAVSRNDIHDVYRKADIFCLPSHEEGFGMSVLEAMASGLPVVVSDQVGAADLITPDDDGLIVPHGDAAALRDALETLVADPAQRQRMGTAAAAKASTAHGWDGYIDRAVSIYETLLG